MHGTNQYDVVIVGAGPAGLATALHLARHSSAIAARTLILEAAHHPRRKICGGALTVHGEEQLMELGVHIDVPAAQVNQLRFRLGRHVFTVDHPHAMRVVQRADFDAALAHAACERGLTMHCGERVLDLRPITGGVEVVTQAATYRASVVVAADGANSVVRQKLGIRSPVGIARLLQVLTPIEPSGTPEYVEQAASFDFSCMRAGVQGYVWDFPCVVEGRPYINRGIFDSRIAPLPRAHLKHVFLASLAERGVAPGDVQIVGHPVRWFDPLAVFAQPHVVLVGDAAGIDPLFAEGISYALEYGAVAAEAIADTFIRHDYSFTNYNSMLQQQHLGRMLRFKMCVARMLYKHPRSRAWTLLWALASIAPTPIKHRVGQALGVLPSR